MMNQMIKQSVTGLTLLVHEMQWWLKSVRCEKIDSWLIIWLQNLENQTWYADYMKQFVYYTLWIIAACDEKNENHEKNEKNEKDNEEENLLYDAQKLFFWHDDQKQLAVKM